MEGLTQLLNQSVINDTTTEDLTQCHESASTRLFFIAANSLVFLVGFLLNGFIFKFYLCQRQKLSKIMMIYLKNLTAADFLLSLSLLFYIIDSASSSMTIRLAYCNFGSAMFYLNMYASMLFMAHIAYNRYLKIVHPLKTHKLQTVRAACIISTVTWVFYMSVLAIFVSVSLVTQRRPASIPNSCLYLHSTKTSAVLKMIHIGKTTNFLCVLVFMVYVYYRTSREVSVAQQNQTTSPNSKKLVQSRRNMTVLVSVFCVCFIPYHVVHLPYIFLGCSQSQVFYFLKELTLVFSALNVCLDPFIYFIFCKDFREQLKNTFCLRKDSPAPTVETGIRQGQVS
ncbi:P2Y purinoceptor 14-like [Sphaeramia orbicularis]|uniref:P2Y purinoceptor 14-like n=1 Tax=Sphaeramia orbicularis TaxID=375764 RepID=UPI00117C2461|nr:P2Y purinoceptor 14-like [Sphaeramia orbicularis]